MIIKVQMVEVGSNLFQFKFNSEFDLERVLNGEPWSFDKSGGVTDFQLQNSALKAIMKTDMDRIENKDTGGSNVNLKLKAVMEIVFNKILFSINL